MAEEMTFALVHGGGDVGWSWHLVERELRDLGHQTVAPDLPCDNPSASLADYADAVIDAIGDRRDIIVVGHSYGGFTAPLVADQVRAQALVLVAAMIPAPGETPAAWWENTGHKQAVAEQAELDGGLTGSDDPYIAERLGIVADEIPASHSVALSRPRELAELLDGYAKQT
jgi:pimeloyl-ACP methyl ester carboxylesterase